MPSRFRPSVPSDHRSPDIDRHKRLCAVCRHPHRQAIEDAFLRWRNIESITDDFKLHDRSSIYRHAHACGLFARRKAALSFALEHIIEEAECVEPSASAVIDAVRAYAHLNETGRWIKPPTTHFVVQGMSPGRVPRISNRNTGENGK